jgi:hypothetical protein
MEKKESEGSQISVMTRLHIGYWGVCPLEGHKVVFFYTKTAGLSGCPTQPPTQCVLGLLKGSLCKTT